MYEKTVLVVALLMTACLLIPFGIFVMSGRKAPMGKKMIVVNIIKYFIKKHKFLLYRYIGGVPPPKKSYRSVV